MSQEQPWSAAAPEIPYQSAAASGILVNEDAVQALRATRPWVLFLAVVMFVLGGLLAGVGLVMIAASALLQDQQATGALGAAYALGSILYFFPGYWFIRYSGALGGLFRHGSAENLAGALASQRFLFRGMGILCIVVMSLYLVIMAVGFMYAMTHPGVHAAPPAPM